MEYYNSNRTRSRSIESVADTKLTKRIEFVCSLSTDVFKRFFMECIILHTRIGSFYRKYKNWDFLIVICLRKQYDICEYIIKIYKSTFDEKKIIKKKM